MNINNNTSNNSNEKINKNNNMIIGLFYGGFTVLGMFSGAIIGLFIGISYYGPQDSRILEFALLIGFLGTGIGIGLGIISNAIIAMRSNKKNN